MRSFAMSSYILSIDQGTTSTRACIFDKYGALVSDAQEAFEQIFPQPGWVEHRPADIWDTCSKTIRAAMSKANIKGEEIAGIGITNQRETVIVWEKNTGKPVYNAIVWQCRRTTDFCNQLKRKKHEKQVRKLTGLVIDPYFSASKVNWILKNVPNVKSKAKNNELALGTVDSFLLWNLTRGKTHATDVSNASRTMLMNIHTGSWDEKLLKLFSIPKSMLPEIMPSSGIFGYTNGLGFLPDGIPISGIAGDQQAALFGQTCFDTGESKCTFGTGSFILMNIGKKPIESKNKLLTTIAWQLKGQGIVYALEGGAFVCGAAVQWLRDGLKIIKHSSEVEELAKRVSDSLSVEFVPALTGLGAPHWRAEARGVICGITRGTSREHIARATLEAMALQNAEILITMQKDLGKKMKSIKVDGGASANNLLMQLQSDYLGSEVVRPQNLETTATGAAYLAGLGIGFWSNMAEIKKIWKVDKTFISQINIRSRVERLNRWQKAVAKA